MTNTVPMEFRLYNAPTGSTPLLEELWTGANSVQVFDGLFNVMLGSLTSIPMSLVASNTSLFLGITAGTDDEMAPRVQLGSVPFAVQALTVPDGSVTTRKLADGAVTSGKQTAQAEYVEDNSYRVAQGVGPVMVSEFNFSDVPAGDAIIFCSFVSAIPSGANNAAAISLSVSPGGELSRIPGHIMPNNWDQYVLHGRLSNFGGGSLSIRVEYFGEFSNTQVAFGSSNGDGRFGRKCTINSGI